MDLSTITVSDFKAFFRRDFPYLPANTSNICDQDQYIQDADIEKAFLEAQAVFNQAIFYNDASIRIAYLYLTATYLVNDIRAALGGLFGTASFPLAGRTVGNVSETYSVPQAYIDNPAFAFYVNSSYGLKYMSLLVPNLVGNFGAVCGATLP